MNGSSVPDRESPADTKNNTCPSLLKMTVLQTINIIAMVNRSLLVFYRVDHAT